MKTIGILGSGSVAQNLGNGFVNLGFEVMLGTRSPDKLVDYQNNTETVKIGSFSEAAKFGEILILAVKGEFAQVVLESIPREWIDNKIIIDTTNPIDDKEPINNVLHFFTAQNKSLIETLQEKFIRSNFVKAFNSIGASLMYLPNFSERPTMFICGDSESAKKEVAGLVEKFGFNIEDLGKKESGRPIESLCILWCIEGFKTNFWDKHALKLIRKD